MRPAPENYFVRIDVPQEAPPAGRHARPPNRFDDEQGRKRRRRRKRRFNGRSVMLILVLCAVGGWFFWASGRPGGVSGTVNGFIEHVRGGVQDASDGPDMNNAVKYFDKQYERTGTYPAPTDAELSAAGVGIGVDVAYCGAQAVVLRTLTSSRLLLAGKDLGAQRGRFPCPASLTNPSPWKAK